MILVHSIDAEGLGGSPELARILRSHHPRNWPSPPEIANAFASPTYAIADCNRMFRLLPRNPAETVHGSEKPEAYDRTTTTIRSGGKFGR